MLLGYLVPEFGCVLNTFFAVSYFPDARKQIRWYGVRSGWMSCTDGCHIQPRRSGLTCSSGADTTGLNTRPTFSCSTSVRTLSHLCQLPVHTDIACFSRPGV